MHCSRSIHLYISKFLFHLFLLFLTIIFFTNFQIYFDVYSAIFTFYLSVFEKKIWSLEPKNSLFLAFSISILLILVRIQPRFPIDLEWSTKLTNKYLSIKTCGYGRIINYQSNHKLTDFA